MSGFGIKFLGLNTISSLAGGMVLMGAKLCSDYKPNCRIRIIENIALSSLVDLGSAFYNGYKCPSRVKICFFEIGALLFSAYSRSPTAFLELQTYPLGLLAFYIVRSKPDFAAAIALNTLVNISGSIFLKGVKICGGEKLSFRLRIVQNIALSSLFDLVSIIYRGSNEYSKLAPSSCNISKKIFFIEAAAILSAVHSGSLSAFMELQPYPAGVLAFFIAIKASVLFLKKMNHSSFPSQWEQSIRKDKLSAFDDKANGQLLNLRMRFLSIQVRRFCEEQKIELAPILKSIPKESTNPLSAFQEKTPAFDQLKERFPNMTPMELHAIAAEPDFSSSLTPSKAAEKLLEIVKVKEKSDIEKPWKKLTLFCHPDKNQSPAALELFKIITQAKAFLLETHKFV